MVLESCLLQPKWDPPLSLVSQVHTQTNLYEILQLFRHSFQLLLDTRHPFLTNNVPRRRVLMPSNCSQRKHRLLDQSLSERLRQRTVQRREPLRQQLRARRHIRIIHGIRASVDRRSALGHRIEPIHDASDEAARERRVMGVRRVAGHGRNGDEFVREDGYFEVGLDNRDADVDRSGLVGYAVTVAFYSPLRGAVDAETGGA